MSYTSSLSGNDVLITGGTGAFGRAFARLALEMGVKRVVIFSRGEAAQADMRATFNDPRLRFFVGDVRDLNRLSDACRGIDILVHAAALKRVEVCEENPVEAVTTNILGTLNVQRACIENDVRHCIFLSTDKACNPATNYGATKFSAERLWIQGNVYAAGTRTRFSATRYGNVLGSTGSVVPIWQAQMRAGETIGMTNAHMTRFWMSMRQAVELVVHAIEQMRGGEVFVPKIISSTMGDLARAVAPGAIWRPIPVRPGEKYHESLISMDEARYTYDAGGVYIIEPCMPLWETNRPPLHHPPVEDNFAYTSLTNPARVGVEGLLQVLSE